MSTKPEDGLARIDSMLADYIPPSHLALVATPEEAEALGADPLGEEWGTYVATPRPASYNTYALARAEVEARITAPPSEAEIMRALGDQVRRRIPRCEAVEIYHHHDLLRFTLEGYNESVRVRYLMDDERLYAQPGYVFYFTVYEVLIEGRPYQVPPNMPHLNYVVRDQRDTLRDLRAHESMEFLPPLEQETLDLTPIHVAYNPPRRSTQ